MRAGRLIIACSLAFAASAAEARELYGPEAGVIPFGMGRAYSAVADDWLALHYNPAGLALVKKVDLQIFDLKVGSNRDVVKGYQNIKKVTDSSKDLAKILNEFAGRNVMADLSNHSQITVPNLAVGVSYDVHANVDMQNTAYPQTFTRYTKDFTLSVGGAVGLGPRQALRIGAKVDFISRTGGSRILGIDEIAGSRDTIVDKFDVKGSGVGGTFGLQYRLPTPGRTDVTTSFVWHDIGKTSFGGKMAADRPTRREDNITAGLAVRFPIGGKQNRRLERRYGPARSTNHLTFAFDYSHLNLGPSQEHFPKHLHLGMNLDLPLLSLQVGLNQSSLTFGTSFDIGLIKVAAATYAEELGSYAGQRRDRRYLLSIGSSLGFKGF